MTKGPPKLTNSPPVEAHCSLKISLISKSSCATIFQITFLEQKLICCSGKTRFCICVAAPAAGQRRSERSDGLHRHVPSHHVGGKRRRGGRLPAHQTRLPPHHQRFPQLRGRRRRHQLLHGEDGEGAAGGFRPAPLKKRTSW